jgi:hypothetical protein
MQKPMLHTSSLLSSCLIQHGLLLHMKWSCLINRQHQENFMSQLPQSGDYVLCFTADD